MIEASATRAGDLLARAIRDERDEWQRRVDDLWIAEQSARGAFGESRGGSVDPETLTRWLTSALVMYVAHGTDPRERSASFHRGDSSDSLRLAISRRLAAYQTEADRADVARAVPT